MQAIQVVLDKDLLKAADRAARKEKINRSALIRDALRAHLRRLTILEMEDRERRGYEALPDDSQEFAALQRITTWPKE
jgi:metal-responsive CopG/Arc/MetJ family transcriptional regulator